MLRRTCLILCGALLSCVLLVIAGNIYISHSSVLKFLLEESSRNWEMTDQEIFRKYGDPWVLIRKTLYILEFVVLPIPVFAVALFAGLLEKTKAWLTAIFSLTPLLSFFILTPYKLSPAWSPSQKPLKVLLFEEFVLVLFYLLLAAGIATLVSFWKARWLIRSKKSAS